MVVVDDFIVDLDKTVIQGRDKDIAALENISGHFLPRRQAWCKYCRTREMVIQGRLVRSQTDYILGSD